MSSWPPKLIPGKSNKKNLTSVWVRCKTNHKAQKKHITQTETPLMFYYMAASSLCIHVYTIYVQQRGSFILQTFLGLCVWAVKIIRETRKSNKKQISPKIPKKKKKNKRFFEKLNLFPAFDFLDFIFRWLRDSYQVAETFFLLKMRRVLGGRWKPQAKLYKNCP
jgi:hypothetical protein